MIIKIYIFLEKGALKCYYCGHQEDECNEFETGELVDCQVNNPEEPHYGDSCYVGYPGKK